MLSLRSFRLLSRRFHRDDKGNVLETVLLIAVAAIIGLGVLKFGKSWTTTAADKVKTVMDTQSLDGVTTPAGGGGS